MVLIVVLVYVYIIISFLNSNSFRLNTFAVVVALYPWCYCTPAAIKELYLGHRASCTWMDNDYVCTIVIMYHQKKKITV